jgi:putative PIN family toxin of toxin-antitoxin system
VLDSNVVMAGFLWPGICTQFFDMANAGCIEPFTSRDLLDEISEVLRRPKHAQHVARTGFTVEQLVSQYQRFAKRIPTQKFTRQICRDADDDAVLACALAAKADMLVTGDKDLLVLHPWHDIQILNPADALQWLASST